MSLFSVPASLFPVPASLYPVTIPCLYVTVPCPSSLFPLLFCSVRQRWNWIPSKQGESSASKAGPGVGAVKKSSGPTIIIFVVGGMTYSEMRSVYEASDTTSNHILVGTCLWRAVCVCVYVCVEQSRPLN